MSYNPFIYAKLFPNFSEGHVIQWSLDPAFNEELPYTIIVEVSGTPIFDEIQYILPVEDNTFITYDKSNFKQNLASDTYYRVKLTTGNNNIYYSPTILFGIDQYSRREYRLALEITRKEMLRMRKFTGSPGQLLKRKVFGVVNKKVNEIDPISGIALTDNTEDFGTSIEGGYYSPIGIYFSTEETKQERNLTELGVNEIYTQSFRTIGYPTIDTYDIIVDSQNDQRWLVKDKQNYVFPSTEIVVVQTLRTQLIANTDHTYIIK
jgi:YHS domain-containing protein